MIKIVLKNNQLSLSFPYDSLLIDLARQFECRKWDSVTKTWNFPITEKNLQYLDEKWKTCWYDDPSKIAIQKFKDQTIQKDIISQINETAKNIEIPSLKGELFPFQKEGVAFLNQVNGRGLITDDMGCISEDAEIIIHREGKVKKLTLKELYYKFNLFWEKNTVIYTKTMCSNSQKFELNRIHKVIAKGLNYVCEIITETHRIKATIDHVFFSENGEKTLGTLVEGEKIYTNGKVPKLEKILNIKYAGYVQVYDIQMEGPNHNFIANNIIVHNCGKTLQTIAWLQLHQIIRPVLVICPATLKYNWQNEFEKWTNIKTQIIDMQTNFDIQNYQVFIINYDIVAKRQKEIENLQFKIIILDEVHFIKNRKAKRTKAILQIAKKIKHIIALTGTLILNKPVESFIILALLDPSNFGNYWYFVKHWCNAQQTRWGLDVSGASNIEEFAEKLRKTIMLRRTKKEVLKDLPDKQRSIIPVEIDNKEEYQQVEDNLIEWLKNYKEKNDNEINKISKAEQLAQIEYCKQVAVKGKLNQFIDWAKDFLETGNKLVIFAHHRDYIMKLIEELKEFNPLQVIGGQDLQDRQDAIEKFQNEEGYKVIICSIKAGGIGITLTSACHVVFLELGWTPAEHDQAEDRLLRIGQKNNVNIYYLLGKNTIEERIWNLINSKREIFNKLMQDTTQIKESSESMNVLNDLILHLQN